MRAGVWIMEMVGDATGRYGFPPWMREVFCLVETLVIGS